MKRIAIALVVTAAALAASSARADTRVSIGVNFGGPSFRHAPPPVVYVPPAVVVAPARGYWKEVQVKTWVPERWVVRQNRWGRAERHCEPGHYAYRIDRVWTGDAHGHQGRHDHHRHHGRSGHGYSYGQNHDRDRHDLRDHRGWGR